MMHASVLLILLCSVFCWAILAKRLRTAPLTGPLIVTGAGLALAQLAPADSESAHRIVHALAELTLVIVLFSDAARVDLRSLISNHRMPRQMLLFALPGAVALGTAAGVWLLPELGFWGAALLAAMLAPTDAALGEAVVTSDAVPPRIRQSLSVESGLNDGLVVPVVLLFACFTGFLHDIEGSAEWLIFGAKQVVFGILAGAAIGWLGVWALRWAIDHRTMATSWQGIAALSLAGMAWTLAELLHGNGFIAAFVAGLVFGNQLKRRADYLFEFTESEGQLLVLGTFALFGLTLLPHALAYLSGAVVLYALLSLTVVRMLPVILSLANADLAFSTRLFMGWFGPRGLASILFALMIAEQSGIPQIKAIEAIVFITVSFSIALHGLSAGPLSQWYGRRVSDREGAAACGELSAAAPAPENPV